MMHAVENDQDRCVKSLLSKGVNVNNSTKTGNTILIAACENSWKKCVCILIEAILTHFCVEYNFKLDLLLKQDGNLLVYSESF